MLSEKLYILNEPDLYKILGVEVTSELEKITSSYKLLAKKYHPDVIIVDNESDREKAKQIFTKITAAYNTLKDTEKRKIFDYERRLKLEYEKTNILNAQSQGFTFTSPTVVSKKEPENKGGFSVGIKIANQSSNSPRSKTGKADDETINSHSEALFNKALSKLGNKDSDGAIMDIQTAIAINPKVAKYHSTLGIIMKEKGWESYSQAEFKIALHLDPQNKIALKYLNNNTESTEDLNKGIIKSKLSKTESTSFFGQIISRLKKLLFHKF